MMKDLFLFEKTVYLGDTNAEGNVYFSKYFEWQGQAREEFYKRYFPIDLWLSGLKLITAHASVIYKKELTLFNEMSINITIGNLKHMSLELLFLYTKKHTNEISAKGLQKIAFADSSNMGIPVPPAIREISQKFLLSDSDYKEFKREFRK